MTLSPRKFRAFVTQAKLTTTGIFRHVHQLGGYVWGHYAPPAERPPYLADKAGEELGETVELLQKEGTATTSARRLALHRNLVKEIADTRAALRLVRQTLPDVPLASTMTFSSLITAKMHWLSLADDLRTRSRRTEALKTMALLVPRTENALCTLMARPEYAMTEQEVLAALLEKQQRKGCHEGWLLYGMALPRTQASQVVIRKLLPPHWWEVDPSMLDVATAITPHALHAVTPPG